MKFEYCPDFYFHKSLTIETAVCTKIHSGKMLKAPFVFDVENFSVMVFYISKPSEEGPEQTMYIIVEDQSTQKIYGSFNQNKDLNPYVLSIFKNLQYLFVFIRKNCNTNNILMTKKGYMMIKYHSKDISQQFKIENHRIEHLRQSFEQLWQIIKTFWELRDQNSTDSLDSLLELFSDIKPSKIIVYDKINPKLKTSQEQAEDFRRIREQLQERPPKSELPRERQRRRAEEKEHQKNPEVMQSLKLKRQKEREKINRKKSQQIPTYTYRPLMYQYTELKDKKNDKAEDYREKSKKSSRFVEQFEESESIPEAEERQYEDTQFQELNDLIKDIRADYRQFHLFVKEGNENLNEKLQFIHKDINKQLQELRMQRNFQESNEKTIPDRKAAKKSSKRPEKRNPEAKAESAQSSERSNKMIKQNDDSDDSESVLFPGEKPYGVQDSFEKESYEYIDE